MLVGILTIALSIGFSTTAVRAGETLTAAGNRIADELARGDYNTFDRDVSSGGVLIVRREPDWDHSNVPLKDDPIRIHRDGTSDGLSFDGMRGVAWKERGIWFSHKNLHGRAYMLLLKQFRGLVIESKINYHGFLVTPDSEDGFDFAERHLGPTVFGKVASDCCVYIFLCREAGGWKVWRLEFWERSAFQAGDDISYSDSRATAK